VTRPPRNQRSLVLLTASVLCIAVATACSAPTKPVYGTTATQVNVARAVLNALNDSGVPVASDQVSCYPPDISQTMSCDATTAYEPTTEVTAQFTPRRAGQSCPGTVTVAVGVSTLPRFTADPCR
jgi:hypothetical protein